MYQCRSIYFTIKSSKLNGFGNRALRYHLKSHVRSQFRTFATLVPRYAEGNAVRIIEVGPRDGLQNINQSIATSTKVELIRKLVSAGLRNIEATSFVPPKWVPQLADGAEVMDHLSGLVSQGDVRFQVLTPNTRGLENAMRSGAKEIVVFASATEAFSKSNQNCTVEEALIRAEAVATIARKQNIAVRG